MTGAGHNRGKGRSIAFLRALLNHEGEDCVSWPFSKLQNGHGSLGYLGKMYRAHQLMCEMAHGPRPSPSHQSAHSCGKGHEGCVNPSHLSWKTAAENQADRKLHGTDGTGPGPRHRLTPEQVAEIRALKGKKTQVELSRIYGTSWRNIGQILRGEIWKTGKREIGGFIKGDPNNPSKLRQRARL